MNKFALLVDRFAFEQTLLGLSHIATEGLEDRHAVDTFNAFVAPLRALDPLKAGRFMQLMANPASHPSMELPIRVGAEDELNGISVPAERPIAYAIGQFLASGAAAHWGRALESLALSPKWQDSMARNHRFYSLELIERGLALRPALRFHERLTLPSLYLREQELTFRQRAPELSAPVLSLAGALELRLPPEVKATLGAEKFKLHAFGALAQTNAQFMNAQMEVSHPLPVGHEAPSLIRQAKDALAKALKGSSGAKP